MIPFAAQGNDAGGMLLVFALIMSFFGILGGLAWRQKGGDFWVGFLTSFILTWLGWIVLIVAKPKNPAPKTNR